MSKPEEQKKPLSVLDMLSASADKVIGSTKLKPSSRKAFQSFTPQSDFLIETMERNNLFSDHSFNKSASVRKHATKNEDQIISDLLGSTNSTLKRSLDYNYDVACQVRKLLFGSSKRGFNTEWTEQSFAFNNCEDGRPSQLKTGIVQKKGGPCGVLSCVQATVYKHLLYGEDSSSVGDFDDIGKQARTAALVKALTEIIWRSGNGTDAALALTGMRKQFSCDHMYQGDGVSEHIIVLACQSKSKLEQSVKENIDSYEHGKGSCVLLLFSVILSRGIDQIRLDMDEKESKLVGAHNYCTQEMINLLLQGYATSNAFDNSMTLGPESVLKGVTSQSDIGFVSLFEHYQSCKIGEYYKSPKYPIWVVCSESHFSVMFAKKPPSGSRFDLFYYDGLANQDEEIRLTINTSEQITPRQSGSLVPPLEHCIRTKWANCAVDWNGSEPIL